MPVDENLALLYHQMVLIIHKAFLSLYSSTELFESTASLMAVLVASKKGEEEDDELSSSSEGGESMSLVKSAFCQLHRPNSF
jgi:hypothetical protein